MHVMQSQELQMRRKEGLGLFLCVSGGMKAVELALVQVSRWPTLDCFLLLNEANQEGGKMQ